MAQLYYILHGIFIVMNLKSMYIIKCNVGIIIIMKYTTGYLQHNG